MIEYISGKLIKKQTNNITVDVHGLGYKVYISLNTYDKLPNLNDNVSLDTYFSVSENSQDLYGFYDILEKGEVKMLTDLPGIGPKTARRIIVELKDKFVKSNDEDLPIEDINDNSDAYVALVSLGFKSNNVKTIIRKIKKDHVEINTEDLIKYSLKELR